MNPQKQWRIDNVRLLKDARLKYQKYVRWSESWDHDHCAACWATFAEVESDDVLHEGYATLDDYKRVARYDWVCVTCFDDLKEDLGWVAVDSEKA